MNLVVVTPPTAEPVTLAEARAQCRVTHTYDDALLSRYIMAARESAEHILQRSIVEKTYELSLDEFPTGEIVLPMGPVEPSSAALTVSSVKYTDTSGAEITVDPSAYVLDGLSHQPRLVPVSGWPTTKDVPNAVRVRYVSGPDAGSAPSSVCQWMLLRIGSSYEYREAEAAGAAPATALPFVDRLLDKYRSFL